MPEVTTELEFGSVFQLLVAVILSAQCTDKRVNQITPELFRNYPDAASMAAAEPDEIYEYVKSVSYPNAKAKHLVEMARMLMSEHGGEVPEDFDQLLRLPGVGRKTANVMQAVAFGRSAMAVDTHVYRVSHRLGLVPRTANTPYKVEQELMKNVPVEDVPRAHHCVYEPFAPLRQVRTGRRLPETHGRIAPLSGQKERRTGGRLFLRDCHTWPLLKT